MNYVPSRIACQKLGVHAQTLRKWDNKGKIETIRTESGQRRYNITPILIKQNKQETINLCYCRVSSAGQKDNLENQVNYMKKLFPNHVIIQDIGSGLNFERKGLKKILDYANQKVIGQVVVAYKDRLARFGFSLIKQIVENSGGQVMVLNNRDFSKEEELVEDILSIITVFTARVSGLRSYRDKIEKDKTLLNNPTTTDNKKVDGGCEISI